MKIWIVRADCGDYYCGYCGEKHLCSMWTTKAAAEHAATTCTATHDDLYLSPLADRFDHEVIEAELSGDPDLRTTALGPTLVTDADGRVVGGPR